MTADEHKRLEVLVLGSAGDGGWKQIRDIVIGLDFFQKIHLLLVLGSHRLELYGKGEDLWHVLWDELLVELGSVGSLVFEENALLVLDGGVSEVDVEETWNNHKEDEEGTEENEDLVLLLKKVFREGDSNGIATRSIWVTILLKVLVGCLISQDGVCLGKSDELLDSEWVVRVLIWMHGHRESSVCFLDLLQSCIS